MDINGLISLLLGPASRLSSVRQNNNIGQFYETNAGAALGFPHMTRQAEQARESQFQAGIRATPWFSEFVKQYGEEPDLNTKDYDYRAAWAAGLRPAPNPHDAGRYHWPSSLPSGQMLKSSNHPTAWKEHFMRATGVDPDSIGVTQETAQTYIANVNRAK